MTEIWVNIPDSNGRYQISNLANIKTTTNVNIRGRIMPDHPKIIKQHLNSDGYLFVNIVLKKGECVKTIHRLMAEIFLPNPLFLPSVNHIDCNKLNNAIGNLEWCTIEYNTGHAHKNGRFPNPTGIKNPAAKITDEIALKIFHSDIPTKELARELNVHISRVYDIKSGVSWNHLTGLPLKSYRK